MCCVELLWYYQEGVLWLFFDYWEDFFVLILEVECGDLMVVYYCWLIGDDEVVKFEVVCVWSIWEGCMIMLLFDFVFVVYFVDGYYVFVFVWIENYYFVNKGFVEEGQLLCDVYWFVGILGVIVQGCYDIVIFVCMVWELLKVWLEVMFEIVFGVGYVYNELGIFEVLVVVMDWFVS